MPAVSLVVCVHRERELLERLLISASKCFDNLVVLHDGPENLESTANALPLSLDFGAIPPGTTVTAPYSESPKPSLPDGVGELVAQHGGRFFEHPKIGSLEGQSPFAWHVASHDWILRLDADEFPSEELKDWLCRFREAPEPPEDVSGYTCIWPLWDGEKTATTGWPRGRIFLFHRRRVRFFGLVEQVPIPDGRFVPVELVLHHQPKRKSFGLANILLRKQAFRWRSLIAESLLGLPTDLPRWRWDSPEWPEVWEAVRRAPIRTAFYRLLFWPLFDLRNQLRRREWPIMAATLSGPVHHFLICLSFWRAKAKRRAP